MVQSPRVVDVVVVVTVVVEALEVAVTAEVEVEGKDEVEGRRVVELSSCMVEAQPAIPVLISQVPDITIKRLNDDQIHILGSLMR